MPMINAGRDCEECEYCIINDDDKAKIKVKCKYREKEYYWGQCIPCEDKRKRRYE